MSKILTPLKALKDIGSLKENGVKQCQENKKPFIVENVINRKRFEFLGIYKLCKRLYIYIYEVGRHTYFTNIECDLLCEQHQDFKHGGVRINNDGYNQGGSNVHIVIEKWLKQVIKNGTQ